MRRTDWQLRFAEFAKARANTPFKWGENDCCLFASGAVAAMTDVDHAAHLRGYADALAAQRILEEHGGLRQLATDLLGPEISPLMAAVGDVVLVQNEGRDLLAICNGTNALAPGRDGIAVLHMDNARAAWRI